MNQRKRKLWLKRIRPVMYTLSYWAKQPSETWRQFQSVLWRMDRIHPAMEIPQSADWWSARHQLSVASGLDVYGPQLYSGEKNEVA